MTTRPYTKYHCHARSVRFLSRAAFVYDDRLSRHTLSDTHPMKPARLRYTYELLDSYGAFAAPDVDVVSSASASEADVLSYHSPEYLAAVQGLSRGDAAINPAAFNFGAGDNPYYEGIYDAAMLSTGASLRAASMLIDGEHSRAFSISGGLHHAMPGYAFGFCVFNDPVIAIKALLARGARVAYVDVDCHHGDGVQHAFYDTDRVLTVSLHESGAFLFPGTGLHAGNRRGQGDGDTPSTYRSIPTPPTRCICGRFGRWCQGCSRPSGPTFW